MSHSVGIDRPSLLKVRRRYNELNDLMNNLQTKLSEVSASVDKDFLSSYRVHMMAIQAEIKELKQDIERGEQALNNDGTVAKLEAEVKWFVDECTRLRIHVSTMESDCQQMKIRMVALNEQKAYLSEQLKAIIKRNTVLESEIQYLRTSGDHEMTMGDSISLHERQSVGLNSSSKKLREIQRLNASASTSKSIKNRSGMQDLPDQRNIVWSQSMSALGNSTGFPGKWQLGRIGTGNQGGILEKSLARNQSMPLPERSFTHNDLAGSRSNNNLSTTIPPAIALSTSMVMASSPLSSPALSPKAVSPKPLSPSSMLGRLEIGTPESPKSRLRTISRGSSRFASPMASPKHGSRSSGARSPNRPPHLNPTGFYEQPLPERSEEFTYPKNQRAFLQEILRSRSEAEIIMEQAIVDIFEEIKERKNHAAQLASIKRLSGYEQDAFIRVPSPEKSEKRPTTTKSIRAVSAESGEMQQNGVIFVNNGMEIDPSTESGERMYMKMNSYSRGKDIPQITSVGGLSNLGLENFSDNDRFSVVVKYLMNYNQFKKVVDRLCAMREE